MKSDTYQVTFSAQVVINFNDVEDTRLCALVVNPGNAIHVNTMVEGCVPVAITNNALAASVRNSAEHIVRSDGLDNLHKFIV